MADNTIRALRVLQAGIEAVAATRVLTMDTQPTAGDTITINGIAYAWVNSGAVSGQINRGADLAAAKVNLVAAINGTDLIQAGPNPFVSAAAFISHSMTITARIPGPRGNDYTLAETFTAGTNVWAGATMTGGSMARGTQVAAVTKLAVEQLQFGDEDEKIYNPQVQNGNLTRHTGPGTPTQHGTRINLPDQAAFWEQLPWYLSALFGAPVLTGALGGPYTMTWTQAPSTNPNPYSFTLQRRLSNGVGDNIDEYATYCMLSQFGLQFAVNEALRLAAGQGFAQAFQTLGGGITSALTLPDFATQQSARASLYFDALFANVGNTQVEEAVIGFSLDLLGGIFPRHTADGRSTLDFTKHQINGGERGMDLEVQCLLDPTLYAAERTRASSPDTNQFAVRLKVEGDDSRSLNIDMMMQHDTPLPPPSEDQGQDVVTFRLVDCADSTNFLRITLVLPDTYALL